MFKYLTLMLLLLANAHLAQSQDYFLSPAFPPTGFYQQYYEIRFRVRGLSFPNFTFTNLPSFFKGDANGVVSGVPNITGTFRFTVTYGDDKNSNSQKVVISIADSPNTAASNAQSQAVVNLIIQAASDTWIYRSGDKISIQLNSNNGIAPITWNYKNLPAGLNGDSNGLISGTVAKDGSYSFSASCGDAKGKNAQSFYTLNVQPGTLIRTNNIIPVPDRSVPVVYDLSQVQSQQIAADKAVINAAAVVSSAKAATQASQAAQAMTQLAFNLAGKQDNTAEKTVFAAQILYDQSVEVAHRAEANLNTAKNIVAIAQTAYDNAVQNLKTAKANLVAAQAAFDAASALFAASNAAFIKAQNELSQAQTDYTNALASFKDAQNANNIAWNNVQVAKAALDAANAKLQEANQQVTNAKNNVGLATQANDDAQTNLNVADAALNAAQHTLQDANKAIADLRGEGNQAKTDLGIANFNLNQALNTLYVAQAAKAASDKATAIAYAQGAASIDILKGESTYVFSGCNQQVYPSISGTVAVSTLVASGAKLNSGHILTWGDCTEKTVTIAPSDVITFVGSIRNGVISAASITKQ